MLSTNRVYGSDSGTKEDQMAIETVVHLFGALVVFHAFHALGEVHNVRYKVARLVAVAANNPWKEKSFKMDSMGKIVGGLSLFALVLMGGTFALLEVLSVSVLATVAGSAALIVVTEAVSFVGFNAYHVQVESITARVRRQ
jgi:hypothetical protein